MQKSINDFYTQIKDLLTYEEFQQQIKTQYKQYNGLFTKETIALLIVDEQGRNQTPITKINHIQPNHEYTLQGTITDIQETKQFTRKNGTRGKVLNLTLTDDTGTCRLVLWNKDVSLIDQYNIKPGIHLKIINGYTKQGYNGIEIHLGRWGALEPLQEQPETKVHHEPAATELTGTLAKREHTNTFFKNDGTIGFVTTITLKQQHNQYHITLWGTHVKEIQQYNIGDTLHFTGIKEKIKNNKTELHLNDSGTIRKQF